MLKTLVIVRHGKATREYMAISDFDRPLKESGIVNTHFVAQKIKDKGIKPECMISSPAIRALHTAVIVAKDLSYPMEKIVLNPEIYEGSVDEILNVIKDTNNSCNCVFIFGHNPVFTDLPNHFLKRPIDNLPTSGAVILRFDTPFWVEISKKVLKEEDIIAPRTP